MEFYIFGSERMRREEGELPTDALLWIDAERTDTDWPQRVRDLLGAAVYDRHLADLQNERHPPFCDGSDDYDLLIVRGPDPASPPELPRTNPYAFVLTSRSVVSVRPPGDPLFDGLREMLLQGRRRMPTSPAMLLHLLLNQVGDALLAMREPMNAKLAELQSRVLDHRDPFDDWQMMMDMRSHCRWLETNLGVQREAIAGWRAESAVVVLDEALRVRFNDLDDHLARVERHAGVVESDINTLVQVNFAARGERTNRVMQFLTVISAVFLPLNLVAGLFGMNFQDMPLLAAPWAFWAVLAFMWLVALGLLLGFRLRSWI